MAEVTLTPMTELMACPGETRTFTCKVNGGHSVMWAVSEIAGNPTLNSEMRSSDALAPFMLEVKEVTNNSGTITAITSTATVVVNAALDGRIISCSTSTQPAQSSTLVVVGK